MQNFSFFEQTLEGCKARYEKILERLYPSKKNTGFSEENLLVNFSKAYDSLLKKSNQNESISWFEFQLKNRIGENRNDNHLDCLVIDDANKRILFIEGKRIQGTPKIREVGWDVYRIINIFDDRKDEFFERINGYDDYTFYGVLLSDVWVTEKSKIKRNVLKSYEEFSFFSKNSSFKESLYYNFQDKTLGDKVMMRMENGGLKYFTRHINVKNSDENLYLLLAIFELK